MLEIIFSRPLKKERVGGVNGEYRYGYARTNKTEEDPIIIEYLPRGLILKELNEGLTRFLISPEYQEYDPPEKNKKFYVIRTPGTAISIDKDAVHFICHNGEENE